MADRSEGSVAEIRLGRSDIVSRSELELPVQRLANDTQIFS